MERTCIDTDVLVELARKKLIRRVDKALNLYLTSITLYEYLRGLAYIGRDLGESKEELESRFNVIHLSSEAIIMASKIYSATRREGFLASDLDLLIASMCIVNDIPLSTQNEHHYSKLTRYGLKLMDPSLVLSRVEKARA